MDKKEVYEAELNKMNEIFKDVDPMKRQLVEGLIKDAAFIAAENHDLRQSLTETGMVIVHPTRHELQKPIESARQYRQNVNSYSVIIKALGTILNKTDLEDDDDMDEFE